MSLFKRKKINQHNKTYSGGINFWRLHFTMAYHFPPMQIHTWDDRLHFSKTLLKWANYFLNAVAIVILSWNQSLSDRNDRSLTSTGGQDFICFSLLYTAI